MIALATTGVIGPANPGGTAGRASHTLTAELRFLVAGQRDRVARAAGDMGDELRAGKPPITGDAEGRKEQEREDEW